MVIECLKVGLRGCMKTQKLFLSFKNYEMYLGKEKIYVTKHFFMFFLQLAIAFKQNESWYSQGWCEMEDFLHLPSWENTSLRDAGKNTVRGLKKVETQVALHLNSESTPLVIKQDKAYIFRLNDKIIEDVKFGS